MVKIASWNLAINIVEGNYDSR